MDPLDSRDDASNLAFRDLIVCHNKIVMSRLTLPVHVASGAFLNSLVISLWSLLDGHCDGSFWTLI